MTPLTLILRPQRAERIELIELARERFRRRWGVEMDVDVSDWSAAQLADLITALAEPAP